MKKISFYLFSILSISIAFAYFTIYPKFDIIDGFSAKSIASHKFIANRNQAQTEKEDNNIPSMDLATNTLDEKNKSVSSQVWVFKKRTAKFKAGLGAILIPPGKENGPIDIPKPNRTKRQINQPYPYGNLEEIDTVFSTVDYKKIDGAVDFAFKKEYKTRTVLILYKGFIIKEKYAEGFDENSIILGWSMAKSVTASVLGVLEKQGKISLEQNGLFDEWKNDARKNITLKNLLNMNSGLEWSEDYGAISDVTKMLFIEPKMGQVQLEKTLAGKPNESWKYSSGTTNLLSGFIRNQFGSHQEYMDFWYSAFIDKIGMHSMIIEPDFSGTYVGSSYGWANTRDWGKFGQFYLQDGMWNGEQIINKSWIDFSHEPTNTSNGIYGGHFWLNNGEVYPDIPRDMYYCAGYQGQYVFIIPSKDLVVVRTGLEESPVFDGNGFLKRVLEAFD